MAVPFISYSIKSKKAKNQFLAGFNQQVSDLNLKVDVQEDWRNRYILGLDSSKNSLVYYQSGDNEKISQVSLHELSRAVVHQSYLNSDNPNTTGKSLEQVILQLHFKSPNKKPLYLEIYNHELHSDVLGETLLASKWAELINQHLIK